MPRFVNFVLLASLALLNPPVAARRTTYNAAFHVEAGMQETVFVHCKFAEKPMSSAFRAEGTSLAVSEFYATDSTCYCTFTNPNSIVVSGSLFKAIAYCVPK